VATVRTTRELRYILELTKEEARDLLDELAELPTDGLDGIYIELLDVWESQN
jgi:hypothetical protein